MNNKQIIKCDECEFEFYLSAVKIEQSIVYINDVPVILVYFTCPNCNKIYRVSVQDKRYYELVEDLEKAKRRMRKNHGSNNEDVVKLLHSMVLTKKQRLTKYVEKVNKMFPGTFTFVTSENNHKDKIIYLP